ncbi:hypothetical protein BKA70DRAFT_402199 [Coprinopsis sp. MPI-PUGE-AT-0042]|nr:hypothetical protein BKA70DRAFT_402199 [Coprinopsis sp. MPI-PUGE-AT-0042]
MADRTQSPAGAVMFNGTNGQTIGNSSFSAAGRDHINLTIHVETGGSGHHLSTTSQILESVETPSLPLVQLSVQHPHLLTRIYQRIIVWLNVLIAWFVLSGGSNITPFDSSPLSLVRQCVSAEEEVYERSLLPKGQGFPVFNPPPLDKTVRVGDFGILGRDGFESFGNLFDPNDQQEFSISSPPQCDARRHPRRLREGQVVASGIEDARISIDNDQRTTNQFEFRFRETQGAALALTSNGELESLTPKSRNQLREYLCNHGTQLIRTLTRKHHLELGQSLYVVTGTINSDSWAIAVHTSPMQEPYDQMVLTRRGGNSGFDIPTDEFTWTCRGKADARCGASSSIDEEGGRVKDQCLFLRGFLLTPSPDVERDSTPDDDDGVYPGNSGSGSNSSHLKGSEHPSGKGDHARRTRQDARNSDNSASSGRSPQHHHRGSLEALALVQPFPELTAESKLKHYYPSRCLNEMLLVDKNVHLAITHDDDWRHKIRDGYFDDEALSTFMMDLGRTNVPIILSHGAAATLPIACRAQDYWQKVTERRLEMIDHPTSILFGSQNRSPAPEGSHWDNTSNEALIFPLEASAPPVGGTGKTKEEPVNTNLNTEIQDLFHEHYTGTDEEHFCSTCPTLVSNPYNEGSDMSTNGIMLRFRDLSLEYEPNFRDEQQIPANISSILFIAEGLDQNLQLISRSSNHWICNDSWSVFLSSQVDGLLVVLKDKEFNDIAHVSMSQAEMACRDVLAPRPEGYEPSRRVQMQNESFPDTGRWILSWRIEIEESEGGSPPSSIQQDDIQQDDIQQDSIQQDDIQQDSIQQGDIQQGDIQQGDIQQDSIQQGNIQQGNAQQGHELDVEADKVEIQLTGWSA